MAAAATDTIRYHVTGMDCSSCAAKIEGAARTVEGVADVNAYPHSECPPSLAKPLWRQPLVDSGSNARVSVLLPRPNGTGVLMTRKLRPNKVE